jgi:hypothetical protein
MAIWGDGAPEGDGATQWLARLTQFFAILRTGSYVRGGTHATPRELLIRLVGVERVEGIWTDHPMNPVETEVADAYRDLHLTRGGFGRLQEFIDLAASHAFEYYARLYDGSADLQGFGDIYDPRELAGTFLTSFRIALWEGIADDGIVFATRIASLDRFFLALWNRNYMRRDAGTSREILVRLVGAAFNPILTPLFLRLDVSESEDEPRDSYLMNTFQNAVTHLAFEVINARRREPITSFGSNIGQIDSRVITRIITRLRKRYAAKLWPQFASSGALLDYVIAALEEYIMASLKIPAERAQNDQSTRVLDNILGLNQEELQAGIAIADDDGDEEDDGLECELRHLRADESCSTTFATAADLEHHLIDFHDFGMGDARDAVREAEIALRTRFTRRP